MLKLYPKNVLKILNFYNKNIYYGWVILAVCTLANFASGPGQTFTFSIFQNSFMNDLDISSTNIATSYLFGSLFASIAMIFLGKVLDRYNPKYILIFVIIFLFLGCFWLSKVSSSIELLFCFAIMRTMGQGALSLIPSTLVSIWFTKKRALALAILGLGISASSGFFPVYGALLIENIGWRNAWIVLGLTASLLLIFPVIIFIRPYKFINQKFKNKNRNILEDDTKSENSSTLSKALRTKKFWFITIAIMSGSPIHTGIMYHQVSIFSEKGIGITEAASIFAIVAPSMIFGQFMSGILNNYLDPRKILIFGQSLVILTLYLLSILDTIFLGYIYGILLGLQIGLLMNTGQAIWPLYFGRRYLGSIRGFTNFIGMSLAAIGPLPLSMIYDSTESYNSGLQIFMVLPPISALGAIFIGKPKNLSSK